MKKTALTIFVLFLFLVKTLPVQAQDFTAQKAFEDYQFQQTLYLTAEAEYEDAKAFYKKNPTLQLREEARKSTLSFLRIRDQLTATYLTALRMKLVETTGLSDEEKGGFFGKIDPEVAWYENHLANYQDADELATLFSKSDEVKARYNSTTRFVAYDVLFFISLSEQLGIKHDHQVVYADLKNFINDRIAEGRLRIDPFNRWLNDTDAVLIVLNQNEALARTKIATLYSRRNIAPNTTYNSSVQILTTTMKPISQLNNYLMELLKTIEGQMQQ
jgi:hypothetical protein